MLKQKLKMWFYRQGIPDVLAYMHYIGDGYPSSFDMACKNTRIQNIHLTTLGRNLYK
jgi:hypothetical protein